MPHGVRAEGDKALGPIFEVELQSVHLQSRAKEGQAKVNKKKWRSKQFTWDLTLYRALHELEQDLERTKKVSHTVNAKHDAPLCLFGFGFDESTWNFRLMMELITRDDFPPITARRTNDIFMCDVYSQSRRKLMNIAACHFALQYGW